MTTLPTTLAQLGTPIARGRTAEVFDWRPGWVLKLALPHEPASSVQHEYDVARRVQAAGLRVPAVGELVTIDGRLGIVYERFTGVTMLSLMGSQPWRMFAYARTMGRLHAEMHGRNGLGLPVQRDRLARKINGVGMLAESLRAKALAVLDQLPVGEALCHGDFHPDNILVHGQRAVVIDWTDATCGHPLADVARSILILRFAGLPAAPGRRQIEIFFRGLMRHTYLAEYNHYRPLDHALLNRWMLPVIAARLAERIRDEEPHLVRYLESIAR
jgi:uncharacterized protein (TIGR02172 family)